METVTILYAHMTDNELIIKVRKGMISCFEMLVNRNSQALYRVGRMYGLPHNTVEDLIFDTHITAFENLDQFTGRVSYRLWLIRLMMNKCLQAVGYRKDLNNCLAFERDEPAGMGIMAVEDERDALLMSTGNKLESSLELMPLSIRGIFLFHEIEGCSLTDTAGLLSLSEEAAAQGYSRAKSYLKKSLRNWQHYTDIYPFRANNINRLINKVMSQVAEDEYQFEKAIMPR